MTTTSSLRGTLLASPPRRLQDPPQQATHSKVAAELNADDANGDQGGQGWTASVAPTTSPTDQPASVAPTWSPTPHPSIGGRQWSIRGVAWYDRNANGIRDSNVAVDGMDGDVEFSQGLGGVFLRLVQCDPETGRAVVASDGENLRSAAATRTQGIDAQGRARIGSMADGNGKFDIHLVQGEALDRHYYIQAEVPSNAETPYFFTAGICHDDVPGWACDYPGAPAVAVAADVVVDVGISKGRSPGCVYVDNAGDVSDLVHFGVARQGDVREAAATFALVLEFADIVPDRRRLGGILGRARVLDGEDGGPRGVTRYLLADRDKLAIGTVTAEVLAGNLDARLAASGIALDSVNPKEVIFSQTGDGAGPDAEGGQLAVAMEIRGHYSPPPELDFEYVVEDSINRDTTKIRRDLRQFNDNCRSQTLKTRQGGMGEDDFNAVVSTSGAKRGQKKDLDEMDNVYSTACGAELLVPDYFETSLKEVGARDAKDPFKGFTVTIRAEEARLLADWAVGPVAGIAGLIVLLAGFFVFRRALGTRRAAFSDKTKDVDGEEMRRFGEAGGDMDDGSVDSAFYSGSDSDSDLEETEKERRMRRKRKDKAGEQQRPSKLYSDEKAKAKAKADGGRKPRRKNGASRGGIVSSFTQSLTKKKPRAYRDDSDSASEGEEVEMKRGYRGDEKKRASRTARDDGSAQAKASGNASKPRRKNRASRRTLVETAKQSFTRTKKSSRAFTSEEGKPLARSRDSDTSGDSDRDSEEAEMKRGYRSNDKKPAAKKSSSSSEEKLDRSERRARRGRSTGNGGDNAKAYDDSCID